jgi:hypothetical protein
MGRQKRNPLTERVLGDLTQTEKERVAERDKERLEVERSRLAPGIAAKVTTPTQIATCWVYGNSPSRAWRGTTGKTALVFCLTTTFSPWMCGLP